MESMRSLDTSLPSSTSTTRRDGPPEQLLQAFRSAALSVTTLYKTAAAEQPQARQAGYQDALDELLSFLDSEHLGFGDGEGWRVRQWATERLDQGGAAPSGSAQTESDEEKADVDRGRSSSPIVPGEADGNDGSRHERPSPTSSTSAPSKFGESVFNNGAFTFRSSLSFPNPQELDLSGVEPSMSTSSPLRHLTSPGKPASAVRVEVVPRLSRHRHGTGNSKSNARSMGGFTTLGLGSGFKRKVPFAEFFDITNTGNGKDGFGGGGKRGRQGSEPPI